MYLILGFIIIIAYAFIAYNYIKYKMLYNIANEDCAALRQQLQESDPDSYGYGITAIKPKKKDNK